MILEIEGRKVEVDPSFEKLSPADQDKAVEEIAASFGSTSRFPVMSQLNRGIADSLGGLVDFVNPFDKPHALNPFPEGTGSAQTGLATAMEAGGIEVASGEPQTVSEGAARGAGHAAGSLVPVAAGLKALSAAGGSVGQFADDALRALNSILGSTSEVAAGSIAGGAEEAAEQAGLPEWQQNLAAIGAPVAAAGGIMAATKLPQVTPGGTLVRQGVSQAKAAIAPYTQSGATEVARIRMQELAGGADRADQLARSIGGENPLGLTPAQQTGDPNMLAVEQLAASQDPNIRVELDQRRTLGQATVSDQFVGNGDPAVTQAFFEESRASFKKRYSDMMRRVDQSATERMRGVDSVRSPSESGIMATAQIEGAYKAAKAEEQRLWSALPMDISVGVSNARSVAAQWQAELGRAGAEDMPKLVRQLLLNEGGYGDTEAAREVHNLYSKLREIARNDLAGSATRPKRARVATEVADAILKDMEAANVPTAFVRAFTEARAATAALKETFEQGAPGMLSRRMRAGEEVVRPETSLDKALRPAGINAAVAARELEAAGTSADVIQDYIRGQFAEAATNAGTGEISTQSARRFIAKNKELLKRYPELKDEIDLAVAQRERADVFAERVKSTIARVEDTKRDAVARFIDGQTEEAIKAVFTSQHPPRAARRLAAQARRDKSGQAMAGLKSAFADVLIGQSTRTRGGATLLRSDSLLTALEKPSHKAALRAIFTESELARMRKIAKELAKQERGSRSTPDIGDSLSGARANRMIEFVARSIAVKNAPGPGGVRDLQTSAMLSARVRDAMNNLASDKASKMMADAVTDPELFRALLTQRGNPKLEERVIPYLMPYLVGGASVAVPG